LHSQLLDLAYYRNYCQRIFSPSIPPPDTAKSNAYYGGLEMTGSKIYFTTAVEDPWQFLDMRFIHNPVTQAGFKTFYINCPDCGHCKDLHSPSSSDPESVVLARADIYKTITEWLNL